MCKCRPEIRTPFCGRKGCEWPKSEEREREEINNMEARKNKINCPIDGCDNYLDFKKSETF